MAGRWALTRWLRPAARRRAAGMRAGTGRAPARVTGAAAGLLAFLLAAPAAHAHPHGWIDLRIQVLFDAAGRAVGLRQHWLFDEFYSAFATEGMAEAPEGLQAGIDALMRENLTNLAEFDYFTKVTSKGAAAAFGPVRETSSAIEGQRLGMSFVLPFREPLDPGEAPLAYAIFDPTYYIEMLHAEADGAITLEGAPEGCDFGIATPDPDAEWVALAAALDRTQSAGDQLGAVFAETVTVTCP